MTVVRELIAKYSIAFDDKSAREAESKTQKSGKKLNSILSGAVVAAGGLGAFKLVKLASDATETLNVLNVAFKANAASVRDWADNFADSAGRSKFELESMASSLGAILNPAMEGNVEAAADMSTKLSEVAVDLASLYNVTDKRAVTAVRAGLVGEMEPLRQFGVVMSVAALDAFALEQGLKKTTKQMTESEKMVLRYNFIMEKTALAHGDAAKTSDEYANSTKAFKAALKDLAILAGMVLLPVFKFLAIAARNAVRWFSDLSKRTKVLQAAMIVFGTALIALGLKLSAAWMPILLPMLKIGAVLAVLVLLVEDFLVLLDGGDSVIGRFIDSIFGPGSASAAVDALKAAFRALGELWDAFFGPLLESIWDGFMSFVDFVSPAVITAVEAITEAWEVMVDAVADAIEWWVEEGIPAVKKFFNAVAEGAKGFVNDWGTVFEDMKEGRLFAEGEGPGVADVFSQAQLQMQAQPVQGPQITNNTANVTVQGNATAATANTIAGEVSTVQKKHNKAAKRATTQRLKR